MSSYDPNDDIDLTALHTMHERGLLAVLRGTDPLRVLEAAIVLVDAGVDVLEITFTVPQCAEIIAQVKTQRPAATVGAGTVTTSHELKQAMNVDADFIVTPGATRELLVELSYCGRPFLPGILTPSEVMAAINAGAPGVKLFPGSFTGPGGITVLHGPFPGLLVVPTGGVRPDNVAQWLAAGAHAVGAGNDLAPISAVDSGDHDQIRARANDWLAAVSAARAQLLG